MSSRIVTLLVLCVLWGVVGCSSAPTITPAWTPTSTSSPTVPPTITLPLSTPTITPTRLPLALFPGFVDAGCAWGLPINQLLDCLSKFTGYSLRLVEGSYVATRDTLRTTDGQTYEINILNQSGRIIRNIQGTTYWDLSVLTPTPTATLKPLASATPTANPQVTAGSLRFYGFGASEIQFITETLKWVNQVDPLEYDSTVNTDVAIYRVEPDFLNLIARISGLSSLGAASLDDMSAAFVADRINVRSDYIDGIQWATGESDRISFFALFARRLRLIEEYRAYQATGRPFSSCAQITAQQEQNFQAAGFRAQLQAVEKLAAAALAKGMVAPDAMPADRKVAVEEFKKETDRWVIDLKLALQNPQNYAAVCYPPTPTPIPTPSPIPPTPTIPPEMGVLTVVNPFGESTITINGPMYRVPSLGEISINLLPGRYTYSANVAGKFRTSGVVEIQRGQYTRLHLPQPPPPEPSDSKR